MTSSFSISFSSFSAVHYKKLLTICTCRNKTLPLQFKYKIYSMKKVYLIFLVACMTLCNVVAQANNQNQFDMPIDTIEVVCNDLELNTDFIGLFRMVYIFANNNEYELTGAINNVDAIPPGIYTDCFMDLKHIATQKQIPAVSVALTLEVDENNYCIITGYMIGEDNIRYNLYLSWVPPASTDTVQISFDHSAYVAYYPDLGNDFMLENTNDDYEIALDIIGVPMGSVFTEKNLNIAFCLIANNATHDTIKIASADGRIWQSNDTTYMLADVTGFDTTTYRIDLWYAVPTVTQIKTLTISDATFYNKLEEEGYFALTGMTEDKSLEFAVSLLGDTEADIPGTYINDGLFGGFTGENYDFINYIGGNYSTYIAKWNTDKNDYDVLSIEKGNAEVTMDEEQNVTLVGSFIAQDGIQYDITLTTKVDIPRLDNDMTEGAINCVITGNDITLEDNTTTNGSIFFDVMTDSELMALYFYAEEADPEIVIPEGTYYIDDTQDYFTVNASDGSIGTYPTFYATHNGMDFTSMYFFVSGTVEVKNKEGKLYMEINARNSYNVPAHIVYDGSVTTGILDTRILTPDTQKVLRNGQLLIIRNGDTYNILGTRER